MMPINKNLSTDISTDRELYIIHNINEMFSEEGLTTGQYHLVLFKIIESKNLKNSEFNYLEEIIETIVDIVNAKEIEGFLEGQFVYVNKENKERYELINANGDTRARQHRLLNNKRRANLIFRSETPDQNSMGYSPEIFSYHVNVGHGNCSFLVVKNKNDIKIWCVDCSIRDFLTKRMYNQNIDALFEYIKNTFEIKHIKIEKFFLTHSHYDHFNGFIYLLNNYAATEAEFWFNPYYSFAGKEYNKLLKVLNEKTKRHEIKIINSYPCNNTANITILNKNALILKNKPKKNQKSIECATNNDYLSLGKEKWIIEKKINDSSIVYRFAFGEKSILFPGDIEKKGWANIKSCYPYLKNSTFYCLSHHGSMNGHLRNTCPVDLNINNVAICAQNTEILFVQGRHGAFKGIINDQVLIDFGDPVRLIYRTDKNPHDRDKEVIFFEINWQTNKVTYH